MARITRKTSSNSSSALRDITTMSNYAHPDYVYHSEDWRLIRDILAGERRVKEQGEVYLPRLGKDAGTTYSNYKSRAVFVNMVARTVGGLVGTIFRRPLKLLGVSQKTRETFDSVTPEGSSLNLLAKTVAAEVLAMGRVGVLLDRDERGINPPYYTTYLAENILAWRTTIIDGKEVPNYILLREIVDTTRYVLDSGNTQALGEPPSVLGPLVSVRFRVLRLDNNGDYVQELYDTRNDARGTPMLSDEPITTKPTKNGAPMKFIPFECVGPMSPGFGIQRSPILDIATLNLSHYRASAQLEHGRYFTALPVYYVAKAPGQQDQAEYVVGPSVVWETAPGEKPGILEYFGSGLAALSQSLIEKEEAISQLGGRIMGIRAAATSESDVIFKLKQANEMSILLNVAESMNTSFSRLVKWRLDWENNDEAKQSRVELNQDFKSLNVGARELRALATLYQSNILPITDVHRVLQETEFISDSTTLEEFIALLNDPEQFPNQPNVKAMMEGFPDAKSKLAAEQIDTELEHEDELSARQQSVDKEMQRNELRAREAQTKTTADATAAAAKAAANNPPVPVKPVAKNPAKSKT